jgi:hypothetical protein
VEGRRRRQRGTECGREGGENKWDGCEMHLDVGLGSKVRLKSFKGDSAGPMGELGRGELGGMSLLILFRGRWCKYSISRVAENFFRAVQRSISYSIKRRASNQFA